MWRRHKDELDILKQGESETVEFKESFRDDALDTISAFANTRGGNLVIGVNDQGVSVGVTVGKATLREMTSRISACTEPRVVPDIRVEICQNPPTWGGAIFPKVPILSGPCRNWSC